ncbi:hypothetical protein NEUTE1DRAFT_54297, partial [Neurospora tetrasperma FGSC 2508]
LLAMWLDDSALAGSDDRGILFKSIAAEELKPGQVSTGQGPGGSLSSLVVETGRESYCRCLVTASRSRMV